VGFTYNALQNNFGAIVQVVAEPGAEPNANVADCSAARRQLRRHAVRGARWHTIFHARPVVPGPGEGETPKGRRPVGEVRRGVPGDQAGVRGHSVFSAFFFAALVLGGGAGSECELLQWCVLVGCIGLV